MINLSKYRRIAAVTGGMVLTRRYATYYQQWRQNHPGWNSERVTPGRIRVDSRSV
jgi:hypothetical protein